MSCIPGHACSCPKIKADDRLKTPLVTRQCSCGYVCSARSNEQTLAHLDAHAAATQCPRAA